MKKISILILVLFISFSPIYAQWLWDINKLNEIKSNKHTFTYANAYQNILHQAEKELQGGVYSVTFKEILPPSGNKHDYVSLSRYWWSNPDTQDNLPYVFKDGQSNPDLDKYDRNRLGEMCSAVNTLSLAYFYSDDQRYADKAVELLRTWFLNKDTKMNPNLNYSQFIPGRDGSKGRPEGLIDSYSFVSMLSSVELLKGSSAYTSQDEEGLKLWFATFAKWLQTSPQGKKEDAAKNNHSTAYDAQLATYLLFAGKNKEAEKVIDAFPAKRIFTQIEPDGKQPNELWRTLAFHYSQYNLSHMIDLAATAKKVNRDLYSAVSADGRSIYGAVDYLASFLGKDVSAWPYQQISGWEDSKANLCNDLYRIASSDPSRKDYLQLYNKYKQLNLSDRNLLLYGGEDPIKAMFDFTTTQFDYALKCVDEAMLSVKGNQIIPRSINKDGSLHMVNPRDWCSGFFPGSLWFVYQYTNDPKWKNEADKFSMLIEEEKYDNTSHDVGFKMYNSFGNGYKLTNNNDYREVVIQSAKTLSKRFNSKVGAIRSWDWNRQVWQYPVIIDNMMNLELLFEASKLTNDPIYSNIAIAHAKTTLKNHFRDDFSSYHVIDYDTISGEAIKKQTFQGYSDPSAWARGQAWALYGYVMSYRYTQDTKFLAQAKGITHFVFTNPTLPADMVPFWDFNDPSIPNAPKDASAACIIASALYELAGYSPENKEQYIAWADQMLASLIEKYRAEENSTQGFLLLHSTGHLPGNSEIDVPINYADYYFLEALLRRNNLAL